MAGSNAAGYGREGGCMQKEYPNLPLIEERFQNKIAKYLEEAKKEAGKSWIGPDYDIQVFSQIFPNTAGIFENGGISGQAMTDMYVTVIEERHTGLYGVFGGNYLAYLVKNPDDRFFDDILKKDVATCRGARERY